MDQFPLLDKDAIEIIDKLRWLYYREMPHEDVKLLAQDFVDRYRRIPDGRHFLWLIVEYAHLLQKRQDEAIDKELAEEETGRFKLKPNIIGKKHEEIY